MLDFNAIATTWQKRWKQEKTFRVEVDKREKYYIAIVYPYMSGLLHLGHLFTYTSPEIVARYKRMNDVNVLVKFGFHCTGTPIVAAAQRVKENEPGQIETLKKMGIAEKDIPKFVDPEYWCDYFPKETVKDLKGMGFAIDERYTFRTTSLNPSYDAMIRWQFNKLKEKGYVKKGKHPVVWDPVMNMPIGDHDRSEGEGETPQELSLFKHALPDGRFLISATLRPDTVLGITNLYVNPDVDYVEATVNNEAWILSKNAAECLPHQGYTVDIKGTISGREFIGQKTKEFGGREVLVLPATFLDPNVGTGLVHSVPAESADDLIALWDLQKDKETCKKYGLSIDEVNAIKPIPVLNTPEYGDNAAEAMLKKYTITSQQQRKQLDKIRKELYTLSHYTATLNHLYKDAFSVNLEGKKVEEAKQIINKELIEKGFAAVYYELTGRVVSRNLNECIVKIVDNQWFIEYNDPQWKKKTHNCLKQMTIYPEKVRKQFEYVIDWLNHWACTREHGLGTRLPWDNQWVIESLSDSTIQMAYCTIAKYLEHADEYGFSVDKLDDAFFDYVFLGKGTAATVEQSTGIPKKMIETMHRDFNYWYPFDFRNSAKDLLQNHLAFCIFNHVALFPKKHWPKAFIINGRIMVNNEKMSKSKGNFFTMRELYEKHGPDIVRLTAANAGEGVDDANYDMTFLETAKKKLSELHDFIGEHYGKGRSTMLTIDRWFVSMINESIENTTVALDTMLFKSAVQYSFLDMTRALKWYMKRTSNNPNKEILNYFFETVLKLMTPFTPHFCEECWALMGKNTLISTEQWPKLNKKEIDEMLDKSEDLIRDTLRDIREVKKLANVETLSSVHLFVSAPWKYALFKKVNSLLEKTQNPGEILKKVMQDTSLKKHGKEISKFLPKMVASRRIPSVHLTQKQEITALKEAITFIKQECGGDVEVVPAEKSDEPKARHALPGKPAIVVA